MIGQQAENYSESVGQYFCQVGSGPAWLVGDKLGSWKPILGRGTGGPGDGLGQVYLCT